MANPYVSKSLNVGFGRGGGLNGRPALRWSRSICSTVANSSSESPISILASSREIQGLLYTTSARSNMIFRSIMKAYDIYGWEVNPLEAAIFPIAIGWKSLVTERMEISSH